MKTPNNVRIDENALGFSGVKLDPILEEKALNSVRIQDKYRRKSVLPAHTLEPLAAVTSQFMTDLAGKIKADAQLNSDQTVLQRLQRGFQTLSHECDNEIRERIDDNKQRAKPIKRTLTLTETGLKSIYSDLKASYEEIVSENKSQN